MGLFKEVLVFDRSLNVNLVIKYKLGGPLQPCSYLPVTGYYRDGFCNTCNSDVGSHTVCVRCSEKFLQFSKSVGENIPSTSLISLNNLFKNVFFKKKFKTQEMTYLLQFQSMVSPVLKTETLGVSVQVDGSKLIKLGVHHTFK